MFWVPKMLAPESWREKNCRVSWKELLSSAQVTWAAPRWSTSTVKKSARSRLADCELLQEMPPVQTPPMWIGWGEIWTDLKLAPLLRAFWDWTKYVFHLVVFGVQPDWLLGSHAAPLESVPATFGLSPVSAL